jgi:glutamine amidotransferase
MKIAVVDYGMGNLRSVSKAIEHVAPEATVTVTAEPARIVAADRVVVPGQGAMPDCMRELAARGLADAVRQAARERPFLGICIGLQMLFERSEEGDTAGLGIVAGRVTRFAADLADPHNGARLKVPHMGWNEVFQRQPHALWSGISDAERFYFVHSYFADEAERAVCAGETRYGAAFNSAIARDKMFALKFHPEKSQASGLKLLRKLIDWRP